MIDSSELQNYDIFRDCLGDALLQQLAAPEKPTRRRAAKGRKNGLKSREKVLEKPSTGIASTAAEDINDSEELAEFIDYLASEIFPSLPTPLRTLNHKSYTTSPSLQSTYTDPLPTSTLDTLISTLPTSVSDSLSTYLVPSTSPSDPTFASSFLAPVFTSYIASATAAPPLPSTTRPASNECEICGRDHLPLTYHHLIPKAVHAKVLKRGWHREEDLNNVAWLCRACHSFVHKIASHEELAKEWWSVERLVEREDVRNWARWVGRVRWKAR